MIADKGPGVGTAELAFIFKPVFRGQGAQRTSGRGLGLAITHRVIESHAGRVCARSNSGGLSVGIFRPA